MEKTESKLGRLILGVATVMLLVAAGCATQPSLPNNTVDAGNKINNIIGNNSITNNSTSTKKIIPKSKNGFCDTGGVVGGPCLERPPEDLR